MNIERFRFINDPGHAWLEVTRERLRESGVADEISPFSYQHGPFVYLEEDDDATRFLDAIRSAGVHPEIIKTYEDPTRIRDFAQYRPA